MTATSNTLVQRALRVLRTPRRIPYYIYRSAAGYQGRIIYWPAPGKTGFDKTFAFPPRGDEVVILNRVSAISPGTERAVFNALPNARVSFPHNPGYSAAGEVVLTGPRVQGLKPGDRVVSRSPHATLYTAAEGEVFLIPEGVSDEEACFFFLGVIVLQGARKAHIAPGDAVVVLGQGLLGLMVTQLAAAQGAYPIWGVAQSAARRPLALRCGAQQFLAVADEGEAHTDVFAELKADVVIETSGSPEAVNLAVQCARPGGRMVLLGSTRGQTTGFRFDQLAAKNLQVSGAHISSLPRQESVGEWRSVEEETQAYFSLVRQRKLEPSALISDVVDPAEAELFYGRLARGDANILGALFNWESLALDQRFKPASSLIRSPKIQAGQPGLKNMTSSSRIPAYRFIPYPNILTVKDRPETAPMKIGLIGCGEIAVRNAAAIHGCPLAMVSMTQDIQEQLAADLARKHGATYTCELDQLLESDVEAVLISTPHYLHAPMAIRAAEHGKHVLLEKPMALNVNEGEEIIAVCKKAGVSLTVMYCERYLGQVQTAKRLINAGALGQFLGVSLIFQTDKPISYWSGGFSGRSVSDWRMTAEKSGGGILIFNMVHYLDIIRYLSEAEAVRLSSTYNTLDSPAKTEDTISIAVEYKNPSGGQAIGSILASSCVRGASGMLEMRLWGMDGQVVLRNPALTRTPLEFFSRRKVEGYTPSQWHAIGKFSKDDERSWLVGRFVEAIRTGQTPDISGEDALTVQQIVEAAYQAGTTLRTEEIGGRS